MEEGEIGKTKKDRVFNHSTFYSSGHNLILFPPWEIIGKRVNYVKVQ